MVVLWAPYVGRMTPPTSPYTHSPLNSFSASMFVTLDVKTQAVQAESQFLHQALASCTMTAKRHLDGYVVSLGVLPTKELGRWVWL